MNLGLVAAVDEDEAGLGGDDETAPVGAQRDTAVLTGNSVGHRGCELSVELAGLEGNVDRGGRGKGGESLRWGGGGEGRDRRRREFAALEALDDTIQ